MGLARPLQGDADSGTLIPTSGMLYGPDEELIQRERAAEPHQPLPTHPERRVQAPTALPPPPPRPPLAAPMLWDGMGERRWSWAVA